MTHLFINDLVESKELDHSAMLAVRGGSDLVAFNAETLAAEAKAGIAAVTTATQTLVGVNTLLNLEVAPVTNVNVGGLA
jgi:hypothetical protein